MTLMMTIYRIDRGPRTRRTLRLMAEADVTLLPPRARSVLVNQNAWHFIGRRDNGAIMGRRAPPTVATVEFPWLAVGRVEKGAQGGGHVQLRQLVVGFEADPRGGYLTRTLLPSAHVVGQYYTCLGSYPPRDDTRHVNYFTTPFSAVSMAVSSRYATGLFMEEPEAFATVRERDA